VKYHIREEIFACTNGCERLLSTDLTLSEDERSLLEYYVNEVSQKFLSPAPSTQYPMPFPSEPSSTQIID
jgi:hypothetical protein